MSYTLSMKKICLFLICLLLSASFYSLYAASLSLSSIGALDTSGKTYSEWWYTGTKPTLTGTAEASSTVDVTVNEETSSVTADESGVWSFYSDQLVEGDHQITLASGDESYSFVLHLGQSVPTDLSSETTESTVPDTGIGQLFGLVGGVSALALGWYLYSSKKEIFILD